MSTLVLNASQSAADTATGAAELVARIERIPVTRKLVFIRFVTGISTFFDSYTVLAIAFAMPELISQWHLSPLFVGLIIAASYAGQLVGAIFFGSLAEKTGRLSVLKITIVMFVTMSAACLLAWNGWSLLIIRFLQGIGIGTEVPVASAYINEFIGSKKRGRFFLLYEVIFPIGLMLAGIIGYFLVPEYGWKAIFWVGLIPPMIAAPLRWLMPESPRWLISQNRIADADQIIRSLEDEVIRRGGTLEAPVVKTFAAPVDTSMGWRELFSGIYLKRTLMLWGLWVSAYLVNNGTITWLPTLYRSAFHLSIPLSLAYGWITLAAGVAASFACALLIDRTGRKRWYSTAFCLAALSLLILGGSGASSAIVVLVFTSLSYAIMQTVTFFALPLLRRTVSHPSARHWYRIWQRLVAGRIHSWHPAGRTNCCRTRGGIRFLFICGGRPYRWGHHDAFRYRNPRSHSGGTVSLEMISTAHIPARWPA